MKSLLLVCFFAITCASSVLDLYGVINVLYLKADRDANGIITIPELDGVYQGFDVNHDGTVTKQEFVSFWQLLTHQSKEHSEAYFYLADLNDDGIINSKDLAPLHHVFDLDGNGNVTAKEFGEKWMGIIRETPFTVLFVRSDLNKNNLLNKTEYNNFFISFDADHDGKVSKSEIETAWKANGFADTVKDSDVLFDKLDNNHDGFLSSPDMSHWFNVYDTNHDSHLDIIETVKMSLLLPPVNLH
ncbi:insoluble matrix shell protein 5-like [Mytilus trossulus]|uniref:insoluble matrix shell protein 5-like n=1 Tax=Mytilus trossulus TaxID=6551 RepID=UPI003006AA18